MDICFHHNTLLFCSQLLRLRGESSGAMRFGAVCEARSKSGQTMNNLIQPSFQRISVPFDIFLPSILSRLGCLTFAFYILYLPWEDYWIPDLLAFVGHLLVAASGIESQAAPT